MKRTRDDNVEDEQGITSLLPLWLMSDVLYRHVAQFFGHSFWDHWHFSRVNRALWHYYHAHDESTQILERYFFSRWARERDSRQQRRNNVFRTANLRCLVWLWEGESKWHLKDELAKCYMEIGATRGNLDTIHYFGRYVDDTHLHSPKEIQLLGQMISNGHDKAACQFWAETQHTLDIDQHKILVFRIAASYVHCAPNFFMRVQETCLESVKKHVTNTGYQDNDRMLVMSGIISVLGAEKKNGLNQEAFSYFWDRAPHLHEFIVRELCFISCTSAIAAPSPYSMWSNIIAQLPYVLTKHGSAVFPMEIAGPLSVQWTFPPYDTTRPPFVIRCDAVKVNEAFQEIDCRFGFQCKERHEQMNLVFTLPVAMTPFEIP